MPLPHRSIGKLVVVTWVAACLHPDLNAADQDVKEVLDKAQSAWRQGDLKTAEAEAERAAALAPKDGMVYIVQGRILADAGKPEKAVAAYSRALELDPSRTGIYQWRGSEQFKLGHIQESIHDFDAFLKDRPDQAPHHWQRGISYYYAGQYKEGRAQFELHQKVNAHDVENAVWHFLCVAAVEGSDKAREALIPITGDSRVPMAEVYALFAGQGAAEEVLSAVEKGEVSAERRRQHLFYARLYLGLYYEATKDKEKCREHILKAAELSDAGNYMGAVARVHAARLKGESTP